MKPILIAALTLATLPGFSPNLVVRAVTITQALPEATGLTIRGTITNGYSTTENAVCDNSAFTLFGNGKVYQGVAQCDSSSVAPQAKINFAVVFPPIAPGRYHLRYLRAHDPQYPYEMILVPISH
jgi:hypothetical protein